MDQAAQPLAEGDADLAASTAAEAAPFLRPRSTPSPPPPATTSTSTGSPSCSNAAAAKSSKSSSPSPSPSPSPSLLATPLPGRVRTSSGSRSPSPNSQSPSDDDHDDECCENPEDCTHASPTCVADQDVTSASLILDDSVHDGEVEVSLVDEDEEGSKDDDGGSVDECAEGHEGSSYRLHRAATAVQDAPATPRAAQLILEDINIQGTPGISTPGSNGNGDANLFQMFCGMADAMNLLEDGNCHLQQPPQSSPLIRPVSLANVNRSGSNGGLPNLDLREKEEDTSTKESSSEQEQPNEEEAEEVPSSKLSCSSPCRSPCKSTSAGSGSDQKLHEQTAIEATIGNFLSSPGEWCDGWQAWSLHMAAVCDGQSGAGSWSSSCCPSGNGPANANGNTNGNAHHLTARDQTELKTVLRNRAGDLSARRKRIHRLRRDISPFDTVGGLHHGQDGHSGPSGAGAGSDTAGGSGRQHHFRSMSAANTNTSRKSPLPSSILGLR